ncbi:MAG: threonine synthase [Clostridia bacterium]|nr:threonine synthase [Clostridia bacterium]
MAEFTSTRNKNLTASAYEAVFSGLAPDGGLYVPENIPELKIEDVLNDTYSEMAKKVLKGMLPSFTEEEISESADEAYLYHFDTKDVAPLVKTGDAYTLELFHGETCAFKDVALSILPRLMVRARKALGKNEKILILTATSGDTGSAAMNGFRDVEGTGIITFFPDGGVSDIQKAQMTKMQGKNLSACAVKGNFDDCQTMVKNMFSNLTPPQGIQLSSANSINIARLVPQITYYFWAYARLVKEYGLEIGKKVDFVVPTGNFGDILAGFYAKMMGLSVGKLICASNANNVLTDFIKSGVYNKKREFKKTISPSMDILISSNLERILFLSEGKDDKRVSKYMKSLKETGEYRISDKALSFIQEHFVGYSFSDEDSKKEIKKVFNENNYLIDPHTAVAFCAMEVYKKENPEATLVVLSTASPYKFSDSVMDALGIEKPKDAFERICVLEKETKTVSPAPIGKLRDGEAIHKDVIEVKDGFEYVIGKAEKVCRA